MSLLHTAGNIVAKARHIIIERSPSALHDQYEEGKREAMESSSGEDNVTNTDEHDEARQPRSGEADIRQRRKKYYTSVAENAILEQEVEAAENRKELDLRRKSATKNAFGKYPEDVESDEAKAKREALEERHIKLEEAKLNLQIARQRENGLKRGKVNETFLGKYSIGTPGMAETDIYGSPKGRNLHLGLGNPSISYPPSQNMNIYGDYEDNNGGLFNFSSSDLDMYGRQRVQPILQPVKPTHLIKKQLESKVETPKNLQHIQTHQVPSKSIFDISNMFTDIFEFSQGLTTHDDYAFYNIAASDVGIVSKARAHGDHLRKQTVNPFADIFSFGENPRNNKGKKDGISSYDPLGFLDFRSVF